MILNLTQHPATGEQLLAGVVDNSSEGQLRLTRMLTFTALPSALEVSLRAHNIAQFAQASALCQGHLIGADAPVYAMVGGAPFLMSALENALIALEITPVYAFSVRESAETTLPDGKVVKSSTFKHLGFVQI